MMSEKEIELLEQFAYGELDKENFLADYPIDLIKNRLYLVELINTATNEKDGENVDMLLDVIASLEMYEDFDFQGKYRELIKENWHTMHESLVDSLDATVINEESFIYVLNQVFQYHTDGVEDFMVPIWNKCLWNLYRIRSEKSIEVISQFIDSDFQGVRETVQKLLSKLEDG